MGDDRHINLRSTCGQQGFCRLTQRCPGGGVVINKQNTQSFDFRISLEDSLQIA